MISVRRMELSDTDDVAAIEAECFTRPWKAADFRYALNDPDCIYVVAVDDDEPDERGKVSGGKVIGMCGMRDIAGEGDISNVAVTKEYRGRGIAGLMMTKLIAAGEESGIGDFTLEVRKSNVSAIHVYERAGFVCEGIRPGFYDRPPEDALIMWRRHAPGTDCADTVTACD